MNTTTSRLLIETMIRRTIKNLEDSPKRELRNLVDLALQFSSSNFQSRFFRSVQTMLKNENSAYYDLIHDTVAHVDEDRLVTFGMNIGYNGCKLGSKRIRDIEEIEKYNIPWSVTLHMTPDNYLKNKKTYDSIIEQGKSMGIYTWQCHIDSQPELLLPMAAAHPDCAFIIFCSPAAISPVLIDGAVELNNIMLAIRYEDGVEHICRSLRSHGLLYSIYYIYTRNDYNSIINDDLFYSIQQLHPIFTALVSDSSCPKVMCETIYEHILVLRDRQSLQTILWELKYDCSLIDSIISNEACIAEFLPNGALSLPYTQNIGTDCNLFHQ
ncbi:MAG: hypothetical protein IJ374_05905, partial [Lachnospiraceae bacterium]|nr:hypothetical protein [Lachnospiraceae bacterium]